MAKDKDLFRITEKALYDYPVTLAKINGLKLEIEEMSLDVEGIKGISYDTEKTGLTYDINSPVENEAIRREKDIEKMEIDLKKADIQRRRIENALTILTEDERSLVEKRYFKNYKWDRISRESDMTYVRCNEIKNIIINKLKNIIFIKSL